MVLALIDGCTAHAPTTGTPGLKTQDFSFPSVPNEIPKGCLVWVTRADAVDVVEPEMSLSIGVTDGNFQGGRSIQTQDGLADSNCNRVGFDDAVVRLLDAAGTGYLAVAAFSAFLPGIVRLVWNTIPTDDFVVHVAAWFGSQVTFVAGTAQPLDPGDPAVHVTTGGKVDHLVTIAGGSNTDLDEVIRAIATFHVAHTIRTGTGTTVKTRMIGMQFLDAQAASSNTLVITKDSVALSYTGGTLPLTLLGITNVPSFHATNGFLVETSGGINPGPRIIYAAISYGPNAHLRMSLENHLAPTAASVVAYDSLVAWSAFLLTTQNGDPTWSADNVDTSASAMAMGFVGPGGQWSAGIHDQDAATTTNTSSWSGGVGYSTLNAGGTAELLRGDVELPDAGGASIDFVTVPASARAFVLFLLARDVYSCSLAGSAPVSGGSVQAITPGAGSGSRQWDHRAGQGTPRVRF